MHSKPEKKKASKPGAALAKDFKKQGKKAGPSPNGSAAHTAKSKPAITTKSKTDDNKTKKPNTAKAGGGDAAVKRFKPVFKKEDGGKKKAFKPAPKGGKREDGAKPTKQVKATGEDGDTPVDKAGKRKQQKEDAKERRLRRRHADVVAPAKACWERLRVKKMDVAAREQLTDELLGHVKGRMHDIIFKHDASRIIQTAYKYATVDQRNIIFEEVLAFFPEVCQSHYGHFIAIKMLKHSTKPQVAQLLATLQGKLPKFINHKEAADVVDYAYSVVATTQQKTKMVQEFYGPEFSLFQTEAASLSEILTAHPEKKESVLKNLQKLISKVTEKRLSSLQIVHRLCMEYMCFADAQALLSLSQVLCEQIVHMLHTREGAHAATVVIAYSTAKERRAIAKSFKGHVQKIAEEPCGYVVLMKLLDVTDDTVMLNKTVMPELRAAAPALVSHKVGSRVLLHLLAPQTRRYFPPAALELLRKDGMDPALPCCSKKDDTQRRKELLAPLLPDLWAALRDVPVAEAFCSQVTSSVFVETFKSEENIETVTSQVARFCDALSASAEGADKVLTNFVGSRVLQRLVKELPEEANVAATMCGALSARLPALAATKGASFVALALLQHPGAREKMLALLRPVKASLKANGSDSGCALIVSELEGKSSSGTVPGKHSAPAPSKSSPQSKKKKKN